ncbi:MAG: cytochrome d ubiquinol oxidase subunit II [Dehalococcoidia bacterium]|jgi:cytochrome d ubiquinol oxidase subunit II
MGAFLPLLWYFLLVVTMTLFITLDGADLGIGVLSLNAGESRRSTMLVAIGPLWYANETWLVVGGATLFGAFPLAYGVILSSLYIPAMMLLFGLVFRAVSIEFRGHSEHKRLWGIAFGIGCLLAIAGQGFIFGGLFSNLKIEGGSFVGGPWDWLNLGSVIIAMGVLAAYAMMGAAHLVRKTEGAVQIQNRRLLLGSASIALASFVAVIAMMLLAYTPLSLIWSRPPQVYFVPLFLLVVLFAFIMLLISSRDEKSDRAPYIWAIVVFLGIAAATIGGIFPYFIPFSLSIAQAASPQASLVFMLFGAGIILPIIIVYNMYVHGVFAGKVYGDEAEDQY